MLPEGIWLALDSLPAKAESKHWECWQVINKDHYHDNATLWLGALRLWQFLIVLLAVAYTALPVEQFFVLNPANPNKGYLVYHKSLCYTTTYQYLWNFLGFREINFTLFRAISVSITLLVFSLPWLEKKSILSHISYLNPFNNWKGKLLLAGTFFFIFSHFSMPELKNAAFADGAFLNFHVEDGTVYPSEVLTCYVLILLTWFFTQLELTSPAYTAAHAICYVSGFLYTLAAANISTIIVKKNLYRWTLFLGILTSGVSLLFIGFIETTSLSTGLLGCYFWIVFKVIDTKRGYRRVTLQVLTLLLMGILIMAHSGMIFMTLSVAVIFARDSQQWPSLPAYLRGPLHWRSLLMGTLFTVLPVAVVVYFPYYAKGIWGNVTGGGDMIKFVPWQFTADPRPSLFVYYGFLSTRHLIDLLSGMLIFVPFLPFLAGLGWNLYRMRENKPDPICRDYWVFLGIAAGTTIIYPVAWNHDYGLLGDWNISAAYYAPTLILVWCWFMRQIESVDSDSKRWLVVAVQCVIMQIYLTFGFGVHLITPHIGGPVYLRELVLN